MVGARNFSDGDAIGSARREVLSGATLGCLMRRWLPDGSRKPASMSHEWEDGLLEPRHAVEVTKSTHERWPMDDDYPSGDRVTNCRHLEQPRPSIT